MLTDDKKRYVVELRMVVDGEKLAIETANDLFRQFGETHDPFPVISYCPTTRTSRSPQTFSISVHPDAVRLFGVVD